MFLVGFHKTEINIDRQNKDFFRAAYCFSSVFFGMAALSLQINLNIECKIFLCIFLIVGCLNLSEHLTPFL